MHHAEDNVLMDEIQNKAKTNSFYMALGYVGLGTVSLFAITSKALMENDFTSMMFMITFLLTMPVSFLGFSILWGGGQGAMLWMFLIQSGVFMLFWYLSYEYLLRRYRRRGTRIKKGMDETGTDAKRQL